jgi:hypothetical protein
MTSRLAAALLAVAALSLPAAAPGAQPGPAVPETILLPTKIVGGESTVGTVCLDRVPDAPTEVLLFSDNTLLVQVQPSVTIAAPAQCADFTVTSFAVFPTTESVVILAFTPDGDAQHVLFVIPTAGVDLIEITRAEVNRSFTKVSITATSDEPGAILTAFSAGEELGVLEQKGDKYSGRFDLTQPINNVEVISNLGGCAQRAVPNGTASHLC